MTGPEEHISPELVLVDPELAERARRSLPERPPFPPPQARPLPTLVLVPPTTTLVATAAHISPELTLVDPQLAERARRSLPERPPFPPPRPRSLPAPVLVPPPPPPAPRRLPRTLLVAAAALLAIGGLAADLPGRVADELGESDSPRLATPPRLPLSQPSATSPPPPASLEAPVFIWVPVSGARSYRFSLYRGGKLIYSAIVPEARHTLPLRWSFRGDRYELAKGTYRWVVIPRLPAGGRLRDGAAVVDAGYTV